MKYPVYPAYRRTGLTWLPQVPTGWQVHRVKWSVTSCDNGVWGDEPDGGPDDIVCLRVADFDRSGFRIGADKLTVRSVDQAQRESRQLQSGDLLLEKSGGGEKQLVGCVVQFGHDFAAVCSNFVARMRVAPSQSSRFWAYAHAALYAGRLNFPAIKQTTGIQNLDAGEYLNTRMAYPPLDEQEHIANFLDWKTNQIDELIVKKQKLKSLLDELRQSFIDSRTTTSAVGNSAMSTRSGQMRLKYATCAIIDCPHETPQYEPDGDYQVVRTADIDCGVLRLDATYRVSEPEYLRRIRRSAVDEGDILYGREGERWGHAALVPLSGRFCLGQRMMQFRASPEFDAQFLMWQLNSGWVYQQGEVDTVGSTAPHVNVETIRNYRIHHPPRQAQVTLSSEISNRVGSLNRLIASAMQAIEQLMEYRSALITAAVTGQIDVRGVAVPAAG